MTGPQLPRDEQGWRIPRKHTLSWYIYRLAKKGWGPTKIARATGVTYNSVAVLLWKIRHPDHANMHSRMRGTWEGENEVELLKKAKTPARQAPAMAHQPRRGDPVLAQEHGEAPPLQAVQQDYARVLSPSAEAVQGGAEGSKVHQ
jgi:hypothetical protein